MQQLRLFLTLTLILGLAYPAFIWGMQKIFFTTSHDNLLLKKNNVIVGHKLIGQNFTSDQYFRGRPSSSDYGTIPSGASNYSPTHQAFQAKVLERKHLLGEESSPDRLTASSSGLDPDILTDTAIKQISRLIQARSLSLSDQFTLEKLVLDLEQKPTLGFMGQPHVNVLELNLKLDEVFSKR